MTYQEEMKQKYKDMYRKVTDFIRRWREKNG
jgi:hypothetical protein